MTIFFMALLAAALLYDAKDQKEYKIQLQLKDVILSSYSYEELAFAYLKEFGDGESFEKILKELKRL